MTVDSENPLYTVDPARGPYDGAWTGSCGLCGDRTSKKGSEQKARSAIRDHLRDKHGERA